MADVVRGWVFRSAHTNAVYEVFLHEDGSLSCNCPGWVYPKKGRPRDCKHLRAARESGTAGEAGGEAGGETRRFIRRVLDMNEEMP